MKDIELSKILGIPTNTIRKWKQSNDYRYIVYKYLTEPAKDRMEEWLKNFKDREFIEFKKRSELYETFIAKGCEKIEILQRCNSIEKRDPIRYVRASGQNATMGKEETYVAKYSDGSSNILIIFTGRFPNLGQLESILLGLDIEIGERTNKYSTILFITNEAKCPPKYFSVSKPQENASDSDKNRYERVTKIKLTIDIKCEHIHKISKDLYGKKVIIKEKEDKRTNVNE